ncbi:MBL fold metallo-hydrolase [Chryseobacterium taihuense]|uniref:L-ascorbate metabolism protein UlaG, beta-lactamase superfamily n=1 Tax=Chryseobacterium taihuense TaxID=1141221 RepID=A0ABY0QSA6_9FLAO|nr:MBL fold metallo-hydrolase [Chryseobacterium taihuense]SDL70971.1 L-ascorbate metabolism protein UlaG, beta-lactamase superfamily [Chryseobacterium taihuense]
MIYFLIIIAVLFVSAYFILSSEVFGANPKGKRRERILQSKNFRNKQFQNQSFTPQFAEGYSMPKVMSEFFLGKKDPLLKPAQPIPAIHSDLKNLPKDKDVFVWLGHSSYFLKIEGVSFLIDPVLSKYGSPFPIFNKAFEGSDIFKPEDIPAIDYLVITHDHYDHLDFPTVKAIRHRVKKVILSLGVGAHFERWGYAEDQLIEEDWGTVVELKKEFKIIFTPARHFSGRKFSRNNTLWTSYVLQSPSVKIFLGGDSGYDTHFKNIGKDFGPFDLAILENGQYNEAWKYIHALPEDVIQASLDINAKNIIPVHSGKFALALHPWNEPLQKVTSLAKEHNIKVLTPKIGEVLELHNDETTFEAWWK